MKKSGPIDKFGIPEAAADAQTAAGYSKIREQLGVPFVPTIYRILAQCPEPFVAAVDALEDVVMLAEQTDFSRRVRLRARAALSESKCCFPDALQIPARFETVMGDYSAANPIGLMFSLSIVGRQSRPIIGVMDSTMPPSGEIDISADIIACHGDVILPGFWRDAMTFPEVVQDLWSCTRTHALEGHFERAREFVLSFASETMSGTVAGGIAENLRPMIPSDLMEILAWFPTGISTMIVEVEWLLGVRLETVEHGRVSN